MGLVAVGESSSVWICVGDSNTFGVFEDAEDAYPAQLERLVNLGGGQPGTRVVNLGIPALNSRQARQVLRKALDERAPDVALVMAGMNNSWSWRAGGEVAFEEAPWYERLRLVKLA